MHLYKKIYWFTFTDRRRRGSRAGARIQQDRFMRFLYQLSSAHYNWGRRPKVSFACL